MVRCVFHGHPVCQDPDAVVPFRRVKMSQAYEETKRKREYLELQGYKVVTMWSCEWNIKKRHDNDIVSFLSDLNLIAPLKPEDAFCGGRTNAVKLFHECSEGEMIKYIDVVSMVSFIRIHT